MWPREHVLKKEIIVIPGCLSNCNTTFSYNIKGLTLHVHFFSKNFFPKRKIPQVITKYIIYRLDAL